MSIHNTDHDDVAIESTEPRYAELNVGDGEYVIYDRENHQAWIQSTEAVSITECC